MKTNSIVSLSVVLVLLPAFCGLGFCDDRFIKMKTLGGVHDWKGSQNIVGIENIGRFAVEEHNKKENALLEFARVLNAREQVVAGKMYHLTLEAIDAGKRKVYDAKVWVKPWMNFKKLLEFKHSHDTPLVTSTDDGVKKGSHGSGWSLVSTFDPVVRDAALHAVKIIRNRSNSLYPYQLLEILMAKAKVLRDSTEFSLLLKVRRGSKEEKFKIVVNKSTGGVFHLNLMEQDFS